MIWIVITDISDKISQTSLKMIQKNRVHYAGCQACSHPWYPAWVKPVEVSFFRGQLRIWIVITDTSDKISQTSLKMIQKNRVHYAGCQACSHPWYPAWVKPVEVSFFRGQARIWIVITDTSDKIYQTSLKMIQKNRVHYAGCQACSHTLSRRGIAINLKPRRGPTFVALIGIVETDASERPNVYGSW